MLTSQRIARYLPYGDNTSGVLQNNYFKIPDFATFKGSSSIEDNESSILKKDRTMFLSSNVANSNFTIEFPHHLFKLSGMSLLSFYTFQCVYIFDVFGSNDRINWNKECSVEKDVDYFKGEIRFADCFSKGKYSSYRIMHKNGTLDNSLELYYLELFGDLYIRAWSNYCTRKIGFSNNLFSLSIMILKSK